MVHAGTDFELLSEEGNFSDFDLVKKRNLNCIVAMQSNARQLNRLQECCPHLVVTSTRVALTGFPRVVNDDKAIGRMGAEYFLGKGYRRFAFLLPHELQFAQLRAQGFRDRLQEEGISCRTLNGDSFPEVKAETSALLKEPGKMALMAASDLHAMWAVKCLPEPRKIIPHRLSVLGVDNDSLQNALSPVPLSSVCLSGEQIGYQAAQRGFDLARGKKQGNDTLLIPPQYVIRRRSTDSLAVEDKAVANVLRLMRDRMADIQNVTELVQEVDISRRNLETRFQKTTGRTLAQEFSEIRIQRARELLATTDLNASEVAFAVGFSEPRMLTLVFKRVTGELPRDYRRRVRPESS